jgi:fumarate reductase (CoM/CoB) subunit B
VSTFDIPEVYNQTIRDCLACGKCMGRCPSLQSAGMSLMEIANGMRNALIASDDAEELAGNIVTTPGLSQAVRGCFLCENCIAKCEADIPVSDLVYASRKVFQEAGLIPREAWSSVLVDQEWDIFTAYRAIYGIGYQDLTRHVAYEGHEPETDCEIAFFPGCSLAAYGPELCREVFSKIEELGGKTTMIDECCGSPLMSAGFLQRSADLNQRIVDQIVLSGAHEVVFACPGCKNSVSSYLAAAGHSDIACTTVPAFLLAHGVTAPYTGERPVRLFRSCQDRDGSYTQAARELLQLGDEIECPTMCDGCCGGGGAVSAYNPTQQSKRVGHTLERCKDGDMLISLCPTCTYTFAFQLMSEPHDITVKNYLELIFDSQFDWDTVFAQLNGMWYGEYGPWLAQVFA